MNFFTIQTVSSAIGQGIAYLLDPAHRLVAMIFAGIIAILAMQFIFRSIKIIIMIGLIIAAIFFGIQFLQNGI